MQSFVQQTCISLRIIKQYHHKIVIYMTKQKQLAQDIQAFRQSQNNPSPIASPQSLKPIIPINIALKDSIVQQFEFIVESMCADCIKLQLNGSYNVFRFIIYMASVLQALILKYRSIVEKLENWEETSDEKRVEGIRLQKMAEAFVGLIILSISSNETLQGITNETLHRMANKLLEEQGRNKKVKPQFFKKVLGQFLTDQLNTHPTINSLRDEFQLIFEEEELQEPKVDYVDQSRMDEDEQLQYHTFLRDLSASTEVSSSYSSLGSKEIKKLPPSIIDKSFETWGNDVHSMRVLTYLKEISAPQTELTYLCQEMRWGFNFVDHQGGEGKFEVEAHVQFEFKRVKQLLIEGFVAKNKKQGRMFSSVKMLKKIYISFPEIWDIYEEKRSKKSLVIEKSIMDPLLFPAEVLSEKVEPIAQKSNKDEDKSKEKEVYLSNISNFMSEYNLLNQQNPGMFNLKIDKMQVDGPGSRWKVKAELAIKHKIKSQEISRIETDMNSKVAQETAVKYIVSSVYDNYPDILQLMMLVKKKKSIKT